MRYRLRSIIHSPHFFFSMFDLSAFRVWRTISRAFSVQIGWFIFGFYL